MKISAELLHKKWDAIDYYDGGYTQVESDAIIEWYVGYQEIDQKTVLAITCKEPDLFPSSKSVSVAKGKRADGRWALSFTLMRPEQESVFEALCADIITYSQPADNELDAIRLVAKRYKQWNMLLEHQHKSLMDESRRKGLLGELLFLMEQLDGGRSALNAVQGWTGPDGGDQDFCYADGWFEIKSIGLSADSVGISSLEQLNNPHSGELIVMRIDKCAPERTDAITLPETVDSVLSKIMPDVDAVSLFENKLLKYGYMDLPEYREQKYFFSGKQRYMVDREFPKLTASNVAVQITSAQYFISIAGIDAWKQED